MNLGDANESARRPAEFPRWMIGLVSVLLLGVALAYGYLIVCTRPMSLDEGYLMITIRSFSEGHALYDSVFTQYGPFYYFYEWVVRTLLAVPLTHDATRLLCVVHWLTAAAVFGWAGRMLTRSNLAGAFVFMQAVLHLTSLASEPGHPQELVALLLAFGLCAATRESPGWNAPAALAVIVALLAFTKINVGIFFGFALLLAMRGTAQDRFARGAWTRLLIGGCALLPFLLMRRHLAAEWCRNYSLIAAVAVVTSLLLATISSKPVPQKLTHYFHALVFFLAPSAILLALVAWTGTSARGLLDGLLLTPLKMPDIALLPLPLSNFVLWNAGASLTLTFLVRFKRNEPAVRTAVVVFKTLFGIAGALWLVGEAKSQLAWLLPWVWLVAVPGEAPADGKTTGAFPRVFLCLAAAWQGLQAYPIAGSQVTTATFLLVLAYTVCLGDAFRAIAPHRRIVELLSQIKPPTLRLAQGLALVALLGAFASVGCKLPELRRQYASLPALDLPGSRLVRFDPEITELYRALAGYLETECDTFVTYPGINSLYFWTGKRPPTHLNSTGWGQLSHAQQEQILGTLRQSPRPLLVVVTAAIAGWAENPPPPVAPLARCLAEDCREVRRIGRFTLYVPRRENQLSRHD